MTALYRASRGDSRDAAELLRDLVTARNPGGAGSREHVFRREGDYWTIAYANRVVRLRDAKGLGYLARLLHQPGRGRHVIELVEPGATRDNLASLERARLAVTKAIKAALDRIAAAHPELGRHFAATVRRGYVCVYQPDPRSPITWAE